MFRPNAVRSEVILCVVLILLILSAGVRAETDPELIEDDSPIGQLADFSMAYDSQSKHAIIFGGWVAHEHSKSNTWALTFCDYDLCSASAENRTSETSPRKRAGSPLVYDSQSDVMVLFGGLYHRPSERTLNDTWIYDLDIEKWTEVFPSVAPSARGDIEAGAAYDSESDRVILFGGQTGENPVAWGDDTWAYDTESNTWERMNPAISPMNRSGHVTTYDSESDRIILFGGWNNISNTLTYFSDTWEYNYNEDKWANITPAVSPVARQQSAIAYDNDSDVIFLFGGVDLEDDNALGDTWLFDYNSNTWTEVTPVVSPEPRLRHNAVYDSYFEFFLIYGGVFGGVNSIKQLTTGLLWSYRLDENKWTKWSGLTLEQAPTTPPPLEFPTISLPLRIGVSLVLLIAVVVWLKRKK